MVVTIEVEFDDEGFDERQARRNLLAIAENAAGEGHFTGDSPMTIECWSSHVEVLPSEAQEKT